MKQKGFSTVLVLLIIAVAVFGGYLVYQNQNKSNTSTPTAESTTNVDKVSDRKTFKSDKFNVSLNYPSNWSEAEVQEHKDGFNLAIGTYSKVNSYNITFQYTKRPNEIPLERYKNIQEAVQRELGLRGRTEGDTITSAIYTLTKIRDISLQNYKGVEFISSVPESASLGSLTDWKFNSTVRKVLFVNDNYDIISIVGSPNNLDLTGGLDKKTVSKEIDEDYINEFHKFIESIKIEN
ncbi:hypothetical protein A3B45_01085 [Candidatus Daviesbacteria bacterium RIFCSPLOWO2_01_FULL_39_12]|uniref:PsbP C-terminal domain-containing protein n=1 Tax=Candidatus Daviesbacteria bacterium RIFCSPLOWO2_01_FULL_39_12 TaxID=1797785 RepID=A0A1F5KU59_9BACT|nr:MAG: hypothetical protein A3B45_01085 [Candidatus Daviesbacteria bacterium RIFCSPLOWO2_01_FULL_39_12]